MYIVEQCFALHSFYADPDARADVLSIRVFSKPAYFITEKNKLCGLQSNSLDNS